MCSKGHEAHFFLYIVKDGKFDLDLLPYLAFDVLEDGKWITLARELGLGDNQTYPIQSDNKGELYEQCYRILSEWRNAGGTFKDLAEALQRLDWLSIRQSYCLRGHSPSTKNDLQPGELSIYFFVNYHRRENN